MATVEGGVIRQLSVSQVTSFDPTQKGGCPRRWFYDAVMGLRPPMTDAQTEGDLGHALLATYFRTGKGPQGRVKMGKAVSAAIAKGELPTPGSDLMVESRFSGQPQRDADGKWIPLDHSKTLWLAGVPWDGYIDLRFKRDDFVTVLDHKFSADIHEYALEADELIKTVQMPVYCLDSLRVWSDVKSFQLVHHNVARTGEDSFLRSKVVTLDQVLERKANIESVVDDMRLTAAAVSAEDVPFNRKSCSAWRGCPHQSRCTAFKERQVSLTPEELATFPDVQITDYTSAPAAATVSATAAPAAAQVVVIPPPTSGAESNTLELAAVLPPDAPPNDANAPAPVKKAKGKAKAAEPVQNITALEVKTAITQVFEDVVGPFEPGMITSGPSTQRVVIELGPKTLAVLERLLAAQGGAR